MRAVAFNQPLPIENPLSLQDVELPEPQPGPLDLLVEIRAIAVNPVDTKVRQRETPAPGDWRVPGWDAAGVVLATGAAVTGFRPGDRVWYAGALPRQGCCSERHVVDARLAAHLPSRLDFAAAAAMPLTALTAWELLFERLQVAPGEASRGQSLLIVGGAGGVGSMLIQLARQLTGLTVIATASRPATQAWVRELGAHHVLDHRQPLSQELARLDLGEVSHVASLTRTHEHIAEIVACLAPQGRLGLIDDPEPFDLRLLKRKSLSLHWEFMFTRALFDTADLARQGEILAEVARLVDAGVLRSTATADYGRIDAANLRSAHALLESGQARGKIVLTGF